MARIPRLFGQVFGPKGSAEKGLKYGKSFEKLKIHIALFSVVKALPKQDNFDG